MKKISSLLFFILISALSYSQTNQKLQNLVHQFTNDSCFYSSGIGIVISDIKSKQILAQNQTRMGLTTASTLKLITTATALEILGKDYHFETVIRTNGRIDKGILSGDLIVKGFGDPTINSKYFPKEKPFAKKIAEKLLQLGIHKIEGKIICDESYFNASIPSTWIWEDIGNYYGAVPHPLSYQDNLYTLYFQSGQANQPTKIIKTSPENLELNFNNQVLSSSINRDLAYIFGGNTSKERRIEGSIPANRKQFRVKGANPTPAKSLQLDLLHEFQKQNIPVANQSFKTKLSKDLFTIYSPPLRDIIYFTNQKSVNLFADHLLFEIAAQQKGKANWKSGIESIKEFWQTKGISTKHIQLFDGCGLSHFTSISAEFLNQILLYMLETKHANIWKKSLPISGKTGTLKYFGKKTHLENNWTAKTGSMTGVRSYAGYLTNKKGEKLAITILLNNYTGKSKTINNKIKDLLIQVYNS